MGFDYISEGPPTASVPTSPATAFDRINNQLYVGNSRSGGWVNVAGVALPAVMPIAASQAVAFTQNNLPVNNLYVRATAGVSGITVTLPSAVGFVGNIIAVKKVDNAAGTVVINTVNGQTIDGTLFGTSYTLTNFSQYVTLQSDGANWNIFANN